MDTLQGNQTIHEFMVSYAEAYDTHENHYNSLIRAKFTYDVDFNSLMWVYNIIESMGFLTQLNSFPRAKELGADYRVLIHRPIVRDVMNNTPYVSVTTIDKESKHVTMYRTILLFIEKYQPGHERYELGFITKAKFNEDK